ncbi:hypothetical protein [Tropicimonas sp. S265A]|uniref:hypothetical protein n=1 Tax=Tropicimonas sp. S265A TaxID=3415134 RepID=UPI003C7D4336
MSRDEQMSAMASRIDRIEIAHARQRKADMLRLNREHRVPGSWLPLSKVVLLFAMVIGLKSVAVASMGEAAYRGHVQGMSDGTTFERLLGILLTPDAMTLEIAQYLSF